MNRERTSNEPVRHYSKPRLYELKYCIKVLEESAPWISGPMWPWVLTGPDCGDWNYRLRRLAVLCFVKVVGPGPRGEPRVDALPRASRPDHSQHPRDGSRSSCFRRILRRWLERSISIHFLHSTLEW